MKDLQRRTLNKKKKRVIRNLYSVFCLILSFVSSLLMWMFYNYYLGDGLFHISTEVYFVGLLYSMLYCFFAEMYQANKVGVYTIPELTYFHLLAFGLSDAIMMFASIFWFRKIEIKLLSILLIALLVQVMLVLILIFIFNKLWKKYDQPQKVIIIYGHEGYQSIINKMKAQSFRYEIVQCFSEDTSIEELKRAALLNDRIYLYRVSYDVRHQLVMYCNYIKRDIYLTREIDELITMGFDVSHSFDAPFIRTSRNRVKWYYPVIKRIIDIIVSGMAIIVLSPIMAIVALCIKLYDGGPVLYSQIRLTQDHKEFKIYKFRSMITDAEKHGARLASQNDDRITPIGKIIRATRLDELPQLFNIFLGDMTIVGPRPERPEIEEEYLKQLPEFGLRLQVKAGLTGYAQVFGKYNTTPEDKLKLDLLYINQRSLLMDLKLILYTIKILFIAESTEGIEEGQTTAIKE